MTQLSLGEEYFARQQTKTLKTGKQQFHLDTRWHVAMRRGKYRALDKQTDVGKGIERIERPKAGIRAKVEHPFRVIKLESVDGARAIRVPRDECAQNRSNDSFEGKNGEMSPQNHRSLHQTRFFAYLNSSIPQYTD